MVDKKGSTKAKECKRCGFWFRENGHARMFCIDCMTLKDRGVPLRIFVAGRYADNVNANRLALALLRQNKILEAIIILDAVQIHKTSEL